MAAARSSLSLTEAAGLSDVVATESFHIALDMSPPDYVEKISRFLEANAGQTTQDNADSDSGDSLFITQKPVPEAVRAGPRRRCSLWSGPTSPGHLEESDGDSLLSASHRGSGTDKQRKRKKHRLSKYSFPFLLGRKGKPRNTLLPAQQNTGLHYSAMGGFFKCVRELWGRSVLPSLPTVDMKGECISPLSEDEEEKSEDIKIVERTCFLVPSKANSQQSWCSQLQQQRRRKAGNVERETSAERQKKTPPPKAPTLRVAQEAAHTESSNDGGSPSRGQEETERKDERVIIDGRFVAQTETLRTKRRLLWGNRTVNLQQKAEGEELCDNSDATACELQGRPRPSTQKDRKSSRTVAEPHTDVSHTDEPGGHNLLHSVPGLLSDANSGSVCSETTVKKEKKHKGDYENVEGERGQSQEEPEGLHAAASANVEINETPSLLEDNRREHPAPQTCDVLEFNEKNWTEYWAQDDAILRQEDRDIPSPKQRKKVRKKDKSAAENLRQEVFGNLKSDVRAKETVFSGSCDVVTDGKEKKKKTKKKRKRSDEDAEQLQSRAEITAEQEEEEAWSRTSDLPPVSTRQMVESGSCSENTAASQEALQPGPVKRKKHKEPSCNDGTEDGGEGAHGTFSNGAVTLTNDTEVSLKKKKKKKKKALSEGLDISHTLEENEMFENVDEQKTKKWSEEQNGELVTTKKKKKKKNKEKVSETSGRNTSKDNLAQSDDSVSVRETKKKKASSFLVADAEENDVRAHGEQNLPPQRVDTHVWGDQICSVRKKKKKRRMSAVQDGVENDHEQDLEEPNKTCQSASPESASTGVKRKKKCVGNESKSVTPLERPEGAADEGRSPTDEAATLKKRKKKKKKREDEPCHVTQKSPQSEESKLLNFPKGKHGHGAEISHGSSTSDHVTKETLNTVEHTPPSSQTPANQALNDRKKKMTCDDDVLPERNSLTNSAELEPQEDKKKKKKKRKEQSAVPSITAGSPVLSETSLCRKIKKPKTGKRRLHNPSEDFLTDC